MAAKTKTRAHKRKKTNNSSKKLYYCCLFACLLLFLLYNYLCKVFILLWHITELLYFWFLFEMVIILLSLCSMLFALHFVPTIRPAYAVSLSPSLPAFVLLLCFRKRLSLFYFQTISAISSSNMILIHVIHEDTLTRCARIKMYYSCVWDFSEEKKERKREKEEGKNVRCTSLNLLVLWCAHHPPNAFFALPFAFYFLILCNQDIEAWLIMTALNLMMTNCLSNSSAVPPAGQLTIKFVLSLQMFPVEREYDGW